MRRPLIVVIVIAARVFSEVLCLGALVAVATQAAIDARFVAVLATAAAVAAGRLLPIGPGWAAQARV